MQPAPSQIPKAWKKQVAIFGAAVSALIGIGIIAVVIFTSHGSKHAGAPPAPTSPQASP